MLTLRVLTMTDAEKQEMQVDDFSRRILERTHSLDGERFLKLHGGMRKVHFSDEEFFNPVCAIKSVSVGGIELVAGDKVLIRPARRADAMDLILAGKRAIIEAVEQDAEGQIHLALVLEEDPGSDLGFARQSGHRFFYRADEVEPCTAEVPS
jgi:hydrogenase maturation protease